MEEHTIGNKQPRTLCNYMQSNYTSIINVSGAVTHINLCLANYHPNVYLANTHPYSLWQTLTHTFYLANSRLYIGAGELSPIFLAWRTLTHIFDRANSHPYIFIWRTLAYIVYLNIVFKCLSFYHI